jgi:hypothetical protein
MTLRLEPLGDRIVLSVVSGTAVTAHRDDHLMSSPPAVDGVIEPAADLGSKPGGAEDGVAPCGGRTSIGGEV